MVDSGPDRQSPARGTSILESILAPAMAAAMFAIYFIHPARGVEKEAIDNRFYAHLFRQGISPRSSRVMDQIESGRLTPWTQMIARAALRFHQNGGTEMSTLCEHWDSGIWSSSDPTSWQSSIEAGLEKWNERQENRVAQWQISGAGALSSGWTISARDSGGSAFVPEPRPDGALEFANLATDSTISVSLKPPAAISTSSIGDQLRLVLEYGHVDPEQNDVRLYWATETLALGEFQVCLPTHEVDGSEETFAWSLGDQPSWVFGDAHLVEFSMNVSPAAGTLVVKRLEGAPAPSSKPNSSRVLTEPVQVHGSLK